MPSYRRPEKKVHRGFVYLDDDLVTNSLSAQEAGKIDEVVAKINSARAGGWGGGFGAYGAKLEGEKKSSSSVEEELVRIRTRFSVFEAWYQNLKSEKALGTFDGWGPTVLQEVESGHVVEFNASLSLTPMDTLFRLYLWFMSKAKESGNVFSLPSDKLKEAKASERTLRMVMGEGPEVDFLVIAAPPSETPAPVVMNLKARSVIGNPGDLAGSYTIVGQVEQVLAEDDTYPAVRLTRDAPPTALEIQTLKDFYSHFDEPAAAFGLTVTKDDATIKGPALLLTPIAIFR